MREWTIADRYFYQAGPLPDDEPEPRRCAICYRPENDHKVRHIFKAAEPAAPKCPCKKHRSYQAKRKPQGNCEACWRFYVEKNPSVELP